MTASRSPTSSPTTPSTTRRTARTTATATTTTAAGTAASRGRPTIPAILDLRDRMRRNIMATLLLSQGTPMLLMGDEVGRTPARQQQRLLPGQRDRLARLEGHRRPRPRLHGVRARPHPHPHGAIRCCAPTSFLHGQAIDDKGTRNVVWYRPDGVEMDAGSWSDPNAKVVGLLLCDREDAAAAAHSTPITSRSPSSFPAPDVASAWQLRVDTGDAARSIRRTAVSMPRSPSSCRAARLCFLAGTTGVSGAFHFRKSWGAEPVDGGARGSGSGRRRSERMALRAAGAGRDLPMRDAGDGWFEIETDAVSARRRLFLRACRRHGGARPRGARADRRRARPEPAGRSRPPIEWRSAGMARPAVGRDRPLRAAYRHVLAARAPSTACGARLDHLADTGVTAIELMPVAQFGGNRGWGYDGVLLYAPHVAYGGPEGLKRLVDAAHERGLMVFLDVVYNHFGPDGNYLHLYAPDFFHPERHTPWGSAIAYEKPPVRAFFIENALYWLEEYRFDGLRLDAVDQIDRPVRGAAPGGARARGPRAASPDRHVHLTTEDDRNIVRLHERDAGRLDPALHRRMERRFPPCRACHRDRRVRRLLQRLRRRSGRRPRPRAGDRLRLSGRALALPRRRAARRVRAPTCRPPPSSTSCRTTTRSATAPSTSASPTLARAGDRREPDGDPAAQPADPAPLHGRGMGRDAPLRASSPISTASSATGARGPAHANSPNGRISPARRAAS